MTSEGVLDKQNSDFGPIDPTRPPQEWVAAAKRIYQERLAALNADQERKLAVVDKRFKAASEKSRQRFRQGMDKAKADYQEKVAAVEEHWRQIGSLLSGAQRDWNDDFWTAYEPNRVAFSALTRIGEMILEGKYGNQRFPALLPIIGGRNLIIKARGDKKSEALSMMRSIVLRLLATIPSGRLRLTLVDPVGLGANMAGFTRTPDDIPDEKVWELIVGARAWTEEQHIEKRLADLSAHMETVIQKYLGMKFETMEEYNQQAGEIAEPYRLLVVANFPINFTDQAAQRLINIATNGPRCGVYVLVVEDTIAEKPHRFQIADLDRSATILELSGSKFVHRDPAYKQVEVAIDGPVNEVTYRRIVQSIGRTAADATQVRIPFSRITLEEKAWWTHSTTDFIRVPIGFAGTRRHYFELGRDTAQHALIAGRTGSGKSNLLHALVVSAALHYSPLELELYLIDFKVGIEFKDYATHALPHVRVVAIQSEREFGLSVLQKLEEEHLRRGDLFREQGVQKLAHYRQKQPGAILPRILLIIDEFQLFFREDDGVAEKASTILDNLVRQGRATGIHVVLASQSLTGSQLPRSIMGQVNVRVALQCTDTDSRIILGDDNPVAGLLSRPGEGVYNAANGAIEGNVNFQVALLDGLERGAYLERIVDFGEKKGTAQVRRKVVFEGSVPSSIAADPVIGERIRNTTWNSGDRKLLCWLGEPVTIKPATAAVLRRQSRSNLLLVGQRERVLAAMIASSMISLATQVSPAALRFYLVNLCNSDTAWFSGLDAMAEELPHHVKRSGPRELAEVLEEVERIVSARLSLGDEMIEERIILVVAGLQRDRSLRRSDAYALTESGQRLATILREGPEVGVHALLSCDTVASFERLLRREDIEECGQRVALKMNHSESNTLIDDPAAGKLDRYSAFLYDEERYGALEKFRPFDFPDATWIRDACNTLHEGLRTPARSDLEARRGLST